MKNILLKLKTGNNHYYIEAIYINFTDKIIRGRYFLNALSTRIYGIQEIGLFGQIDLDNVSLVSEYETLEDIFNNKSIFI